MRASRLLQTAFPVYMGFEVNHTKLLELGISTWAPYLGL
jgi:hypothetical protein